MDVSEDDMSQVSMKHYFMLKIKTEYAHESTCFLDSRNLGYGPGLRAIMAFCQKVSHHFSVDKYLMVPCKTLSS